MAIFSSKHGKREETFKIRTFPDGLNQEVVPPFLPVTALSRCKNMKYAFNQAVDGQKTIILKKRQGTEKISSSALASAVLAATYFVADAHYIVATAAKCYELNASTFAPEEIGDLDGVPTFTEFQGKLIIHDSGVTKAWDGTTFETLDNLFTDELIGTGDGSTTEFSGTVDNPAVKAAEFDVSYTSGAVAKAIADDGNGRLTGDISSAVVKNISGASKANPCAITCTGHGFSTGDVINIQSVGGMTEINNITFTITSTGDNTFTLDGINSTAYTTYTTGGTASGNAIKYSSGAFLFTCSAASDNTTPVYATYQKTSGAPKSKAGFVRGSRLYMWGDPDNTSRMAYTGPNDEYAWDSSSSGGYIDVDPLDGYSLIGCLNFVQTVMAIKGNSIHRIDNFPGDNTFRAEPWVKDTGSGAYRTVTNEGNLVSYLSNKQGWVAFNPAAAFGDITQFTDLSKHFRASAVRFTTADCYSEFNKVDNQLWITLYNGATQMNIIYVINLETGGQLSLYEFAFDHTCYTFVNNEMLIGGSDGHLYRLFNDNSRYLDNAVSYSSDTYCRGPMTHWGMPLNRKHNKKIYLHLYGRSGVTATLNVYKDDNYDSVHYTKSISLHGASTLIWDGQDALIYDDQTTLIGAESIAERDIQIKKKFNYRELMFELTDIAGSLGAEFYGVDFLSAILGD